MKRERDDYAAKLEETQTILNHTRWQLDETRQVLSDIYRNRELANGPEWLEALRKSRQEQAKRRTEDSRAISRPAR